MKKLAIFLLFVFSFSLAGISKDKEAGLPERYKKWLEEEVVYIIAPLEKEVFLKLKTDRERDLFTEAFWNHRDPTPSTPKNEFKEEHYRRINYANHFFGRGLPKAGWRTDRGRIYIILGEPNDIQRFEGKTQVYPTEVWFYQGKTDVGLPPGFNLVFYQEGGAGEYKLYSPLKDGPQALLTSYFGDPMDYLAAYQKLDELEPELAEVSLSLIPGEGSLAMGRPTMSSDILLQRVETTPVRQIEERYAQKFLDFKDIVEVEYSTKYINCDSLVKVIKEPTGLFFVHYAVEPERLSVNLFKDKYYTTLKLNGTVSNEDGKTIYQFEKDISLEFNQDQMKQASQRPLSIHDMFPLIQGKYKLSVLVKNEISKEFTSLERNLLIPGEENALQMTSLLLGYEMKEDVPEKNRLRPFQVGPYHIYLQANRVFLRQDDLTLAFQIPGLSQEFKEKGKIQYSFFKGGEEFRTKARNISEYLYLPNVTEQFPLSDFPPAHYRVQASLILDGKEALFESEEFDITHLETMVRPWIYSKLLPAVDDPVYSSLLGSQLYNSGKLKEAREKLEDAQQRMPDSLEVTLNLSRTEMAMNNYKRVVSLLSPFLNQPAPPSYEVFFLIGKAYQKSGELSKAIEIFDQAVSHYGVNTFLLNAIGECYFQLGRGEEALAVWKKSLEINPDQPQIQKAVGILKEKKQ